MKDKNFLFTVLEDVEKGKIAKETINIKNLYIKKKK